MPNQLRREEAWLAMEPRKSLPPHDDRAELLAKVEALKNRIQQVQLERDTRAKANRLLKSRGRQSTNANQPEEYSAY